MEQITCDGIHDKCFMEISKEDLGRGFDIFDTFLSSPLAPIFYQQHFLDAIVMHRLEFGTENGKSKNDRFR